MASAPPAAPLPVSTSSTASSLAPNSPTGRSLSPLQLASGSPAGRVSRLRPLGTARLASATSMSGRAVSLEVQGAFLLATAEEECRDVTAS